MREKTLNAGRLQPPAFRNGQTVKEDITGKRLAASIHAFTAIRDARFPGLKSTHKSILYAIASRLNWRVRNKNGNPIAWPSYDRLAGDAGLSRSTCIKAVDWLEKAGLLKKSTRKTDRGASNSYMINVPKLESFSRKKQQTPDEPPAPSTTRSRPTAPQGAAPRGSPSFMQSLLDGPQGAAPRGVSGISFQEYQASLTRRTA